MNCPRCQTSVLEEHTRDGVVVDGCRQCRGLWLDRGELEKLIARATRDLDEHSPGSTQEPRSGDLRYATPKGQGPQYRPDADTPPRGVRAYDDDAHHYSHHHKHRKKRHWLESLGDIFD